MADIFTGIYSEKDLPLLYKWVDLHKGHNLTVVDGYSMGVTASENLSDVNLIDLQPKIPRGNLGAIETLVNSIDTNICFCDLRYQIKSIDQQDDSLVSAPHSNNINVENMVRLGVCSIDNMVLFEKEIREKLGTPMDGHIICGNPRYLGYFLSYCKCLLTANVIERNADVLTIAINLFGIYFERICQPSKNLEYGTISCN